MKTSGETISPHLSSSPVSLMSLSEMPLKLTEGLLQSSANTESSPELPAQTSLAWKLTEWQHRNPKPQAALTHLLNQYLLFFDFIRWAFNIYFFENCVLNVKHWHTWRLTKTQSNSLGFLLFHFPPPPQTRTMHIIEHSTFAEQHSEPSLKREIWKFYNSLCIDT